MKKETFNFNGNKLVKVTFDNQQCWVAKTIGAALGYSRKGRSFVTAVTKDWQADFLDGDVVTITGEELRQFQNLGLLEQRDTSITLLFNRGLNTALLKSGKAVAKELRRSLVFEELKKWNIPAKKKSKNRIVIKSNKGITKKVFSPELKKLTEELREYRALGSIYAIRNLMASFELLMDSREFPDNKPEPVNIPEPKEEMWHTTEDIIYLLKIKATVPAFDKVIDLLLLDLGCSRGELPYSKTVETTVFHAAEKVRLTIVFNDSFVELLKKELNHEENTRYEN